MDPVMNEWIIEGDALREKLARRDALLREVLRYLQWSSIPHEQELVKRIERELGDSQRD